MMTLGELTQWATKTTLTTQFHSSAVHFGLFYIPNREFRLPRLLLATCGRVIIGFADRNLIELNISWSSHGIDNNRRNHDKLAYQYDRGIKKLLKRGRVIQS